MTTARLRTAAARLREVAEPVGCRCVEPTDAWFDRSICPEPCGTMHDVCNGCGHPLGGCLAADAAAKPSAYDLAVAAWLDREADEHERYVEGAVRVKSIRTAYANDRAQHALAVADAVLGDREMAAP